MSSDYDQANQQLYYTIVNIAVSQCIRGRDHSKFPF